VAPNEEVSEDFLGTGKAAATTVLAALVPPSTAEDLELKLRATDVVGQSSKTSSSPSLTFTYNSDRYIKLRLAKWKRCVYTT